MHSFFLPTPPNCHQYKATLSKTENSDGQGYLLLNAQSAATYSCLSGLYWELKHFFKIKIDFYMMHIFSGWSPVVLDPGMFSPLRAIMFWTFQATAGIIYLTTFISQWQNRQSGPIKVFCCQVIYTKEDLANYRYEVWSKLFVQKPCINQQLFYVTSSLR